MIFKQLFDTVSSTYTYLLACEATGQAILIDPVLPEWERDLAEINKRGLKLAYTVETHIHADHVSGARKLANAYGAELCLFESAQVTYPFRPLHDGEELPLGQLRLRIVHTPGHRPELMSLLIVNPERSSEPSMVLTGDSLLVGDVGLCYLMIGATGAEDKIDWLVDVLRPYGIVEMGRTGRVAMARGKSGNGHK